MWERSFSYTFSCRVLLAWAHKLLYGVEATLQAQKEGEEAAAAYEKEKKDAAAGIAPTPVSVPKVETKKNKPGRKPKDIDTGGDVSKKRGPKDDGGGPVKKRPKATVDKESLAPILSKSATRAVALSTRNAFVELKDVELSEITAKRLVAVRNLFHVVSEIPARAPSTSDFRPCIPIASVPTQFTGGALLYGLPASLFGWTPREWLDGTDFVSNEKAEDTLDYEFGSQGENEKFKSLVQGTVTIMGCASRRTLRVFASLDAGSPPFGGAVGSIDCHIGGNPRACSESAAVIRYLPTSVSGFQFSALSDNDMVTMNGKRITPGMGSFPLFSGDVCSVGPRVFVVLLPSDV